jgi:YHS domain-containing protein
MIATLVTALMILRRPDRQLRQPPEALDGADPVLLVGGKEVIGKAELKVVHGRFEYWFAAPESKAEFEKHRRSTIQLGGMCARMGGAVRGNPSDFAVHDGRIYIFGSDDCRQKFLADPQKYLEPPAAPMAVSKDTAVRGRELLERAVRAMGGSTALDGLTTMSEAETHVEPRRTGEVKISNRLFWRFPDAIRTERDFPKFTIANVILPSGGWSVAPNGGTQMPEAAVNNLRVEAERHPVALLRRRAAPGVTVAAVGRETVAGAEVDRVRVRDGAIDVTLGIRPATGLIHSITFVDRGQDGRYGQFLLIYDDYRDVNGLKLAFKRRALFDDAPEPSRSVEFSSITVNTPLDSKLFEPPAPGAPGK